jgi:hypothetical protein
MVLLWQPGRRGQSCPRAAGCGEARPGSGQARIAEACLEPIAPKVDLSPLPDPAKLGTDLTSVFSSLTDILGGVKDVPTAETAAPKLTDLTPKLDGLKSLWDKVPAAGKTAVIMLATDHIGKLKELVTKVLAIPGVSDKLKTVLDILLAKLTAFTVS